MKPAKIAIIGVLGVIALFAGLLIVAGANTGGITLPGQGADGKKITCTYAADDDIFSKPDIQEFGCVVVKSCNVGSLFQLGIFSDTVDLRLSVDGEVYATRSIPVSSFSYTRGSFDACVPIDGTTAKLELLGKDGGLLDSEEVSLP